MKTKYLVFSLILAMLVSSIPIMTVKAANTLSVSPASTSVNTGEIFSIQIVVDFATNLYGYEIYLGFDKAKLTALSIDYMNYLNEPHLIFHQEVNKTGGYVGLAVSSTYPASAKTGGSPPSLANVTFIALSNPGDSSLHLYNTILVDNQGGAISHTTFDGIVHIAGAGGHDIAVTNLTTSKDGCKPMMTVPDNMFVNINITVGNIGNSPESFNVTLYANTTAVNTTLVSNLAVGAQTTLAFKWNTTGWTHGNYTISGCAVPVSGETNTADNTLVKGTIRVVIPGEIKGDDIVDIYDAILLSGAFNTSPGSPNWSSNADLKTDDVIDIYDAIILSGHFNMHE